MLSSALLLPPRRGAESAGSTVALEGVPLRVPNEPPDALQPAASSATSNVAASLPIDHRQHALVGRPAQRQSDLEMCPFVAVANQLDRPAVRLHAFRDDGEPDASASDGS